MPNCAVCGKPCSSHPLVWATWSRQGIVVCDSCHRELEILRASILGIKVGVQ